MYCLKNVFAVGLLISKLRDFSTSDSILSTFTANRVFVRVLKELKLMIEEHEFTYSNRNTSSLVYVLSVT